MRYQRRKRSLTVASLIDYTQMRLPCVMGAWHEMQNMTAFRKKFSREPIGERSVAL